MASVFPLPITELPKADIPLSGINAYLSQSDNHQIVFSEYTKDAEIPEHSHESQWGVVLEGKIEFCIEGKIRAYTKGDRFFIPKGTRHSCKVYAGYADIIFFNERNRFKVK
jgi:quercetin dioxygenase-like cupin family protein